MSSEQFDIVKLMQKGGATPKSFAKHTGETVAKMTRAFNALTYDQFLKNAKMSFEDTMRGMGMGAFYEGE